MPPPVTLVDLVLAKRGQEASRAPALAIGALAEILPQPGDGGQAQRAQHHRQLGGVDRGHGATSWL